ncbi:MAG: NHL repeat-containing protein [Candidatus Krumholzibacteriia bacterium]
MDPDRRAPPRGVLDVLHRLGLLVVTCALAAPARAAGIRLVEAETLPLASPQFVEPVAVAVGPLGQLFLADLGLGTVVRLDSSASIVFEFESPATRPDMQPLDLEVTGFQVYVLDAGANALLRFSDEGSLLDVLQSFQEEGVETPRAVSVDGTGRVLLANPARHTARIVNEAQVTETAVGGFGTRAGELSYPSGVAFAPDGSFYVADTGNGRIQRFSGVGNYEEALFEALVEPRGLAVGARGEVYAADAEAHAVHVFGPHPGQHTALELAGKTPADVAVLGDTLWVLSIEPVELIRVRVVRGE